MKKEIISDFETTEYSISFKVNPNTKGFFYKELKTGNLFFRVAFDGEEKKLTWKVFESPHIYAKKGEGTLDLSDYKYHGLFEFNFYPFGCNLPWNKKEIFEWEIKNYPNKKEAKIIWRNIKEKFSKPFYDRFIQAWDLQCACGECVSNPSFGFVKLSEPISTIAYDVGNTFCYSGKIYEKVPNDEWYEESWWTGEEYNEIRVSRKIDLTMYSEPEKVLANWLKEWPDFEDLYKKEGKEIDGIKKVTKHWYNTVKKGLIRCPICKDAYIMSKVIGYPPLERKYRVRRLKEFFRKIF